MTISISPIANITEKHLAGQHDQKKHRSKKATAAKPVPVPDEKPKITAEQIRKNKARVKVAQSLLAAGYSAAIIGGLLALSKYSQRNDKDLYQLGKTAQAIEDLQKQLRRPNLEETGPYGKLPPKPEPPPEELISNPIVDEAQDIVNRAFKKKGDTEAPDVNDLLSKHLAGQHDQKKHGAPRTHVANEHEGYEGEPKKFDEASEFMSAAEIREKLGIYPEDRNSLSRFVGHARVGRNVYHRQTAQAAIDKVLAQRAQRESAQKLSKKLGIPTNAIAQSVKQGLTSEAIVEHETQLFKAAFELKTTIKRSLGTPELASRITPIQREFLTSLYGVDKPKKTLAALTEETKERLGEPYSPAWVFKQVTTAEHQLGIDVDKIAFSHGLQRRELTRFINRSHTKGK